MKTAYQLSRLSKQMHSQSLYKNAVVKTRLELHRPLQVMSLKQLTTAFGFAHASAKKVTKAVTSCLSLDGLLRKSVEC